MADLSQFSPIEGQQANVRFRKTRACSRVTEPWAHCFQAAHAHIHRAALGPSPDSQLSGCKKRPLLVIDAARTDQASPFVAGLQTGATPICVQCFVLVPRDMVTYAGIVRRARAQ